MTANIHRDPKKRRTPVTPADFHPLEECRPASAGVPLDGPMAERLGDMFAKQRL